MDSYAELLHRNPALKPMLEWGCPAVKSMESIAIGHQGFQGSREHTEIPPCEQLNMSGVCLSLHSHLQFEAFGES